MVLSAKHSGGSTVVYPPASVLIDFSDSAMHRERFFFVAAAETAVCLPFFFFVAAAETATLRFVVAAACLLRFVVAGPATAIFLRFFFFLWRDLAKHSTPAQPLTSPPRNPRALLQKGWSRFANMVLLTTICANSGPTLSVARKTDLVRTKLPELPR